MDQVMLQFDTPLRAPDGHSYLSRIWGREREYGAWEGWIEFEPLDGAPALRTRADTGLETRADFERWASGLTEPELEEILGREQRGHALDDQARAAGGEPGRPEGAPRERAPAPVPAAAQVGLDPFAAYAQGEGILRQRLGEAPEPRLRAIIRGHHWVDERSIDLEKIERLVLEEMIVAAVRGRATQIAAA
jgi:hypothetical protein